jgi:hypothetical protein
VDPESGFYSGEIELCENFENGELKIRVAVRDLAHNKLDREFSIHAK